MSDMHAMQVTAVSGALTDCYWPILLKKSALVIAEKKLAP